MDNMENENVTPEAEKKTIGGMVDSAVDAGKDFVQNLQVEEKAKGLWAKITALPKKIWIAAGAALVALITLIIIISCATNNYKTPVKIMEKQANAKRYSSMFDLALDQLNGFSKKEVKAMYKILKKSDEMDEMMDRMEELFEEERERNEDEYGKNYKVKYKITDKDKLDKDDLDDFEDELHDMGKEMLEAVKETDDWDSDDWKDIAEEAGLSKAQMKKLCKAMKSLGKKLKKAKVTKGFELEVTERITGKELDDPEERDLDMVVIKVNGRWISADALSGLKLGF